MNEPELTPSRVATAALVACVALVAIAGVTSARVAILGLAFFALAGAAARLGAPLRRAFVVRSRWVDVGILTALGTALAFLGFTTPLG